MSTEENKALLRRLFEEVWNQGNLATVDELLAPDYVLNDPALLVRGPEGFKAYVSAFRSAFPDMYATIEDQIAGEDRVAMRFTVHATHKGEFQGIPPTGKQVTLSGIDIQRIADGKIAENWVNLDALGLLQQLGVLPPMG
ncbi:MAG TPA: ester cyclase [Ktedonobacteraceae bacterium]|nr:ester cyclase [Ktedonobacteraceae bacterium]